MTLETKLKIVARIVHQSVHLNQQYNAQGESIS